MVRLPLHLARISFFVERSYGDRPMCTMVNGEFGSASSQYFMDEVELTDEEAEAVMSGSLVLWDVRKPRQSERYLDGSHVRAVLLPPGQSPLLEEGESAEPLSRETFPR